MQGSSHIKLGKILAGEYEIKGKRLAAFLWGNIEPDVAVQSHLNRDGTAPLEGHSFPAASVRVQKIYRRLKNGCETTEEYFLLGKLCHYIADCFTWAHNENYPGTLSAHVSYERHMDKAFENGILPVSFPEIEALPFSEAFDAYHQVYMQITPSIVRDLSFIRAVSENACGQVLAREKSKSFLKTEWRIRMTARLAAGLVVPSEKLKRNSL